jgi:hypothetical protein
MTTGTDLFVCRAAVHFEYEGGPVYLAAGAIVRAGNPVMKGREGLFEPFVVTVSFEPGLEPTTATVVVAGERGEGCKHGAEPVRVTRWRTRAAELT